MRQILLNSGGAVVARVPRPLVERGSVLVRVQYSLISVGTEIAPLRSMASQAMDRVTKIAKSQVAKLRPARPVPIVPAISGDLTWTPANGEVVLTTTGEGVTLVTDDTPAGYQIMSHAIGVPEGQVPVVRVSGRVEEGAITIGLL